MAPRKETDRPRESEQTGKSKGEVQHVEGEQNEGSNAGVQRTRKGQATDLSSVILPGPGMSQNPPSKDGLKVR